jgi:transposase-like protein
MVRPGRERLIGFVEVDETYVGGSEEGVRGRETETKALVAIAAEARGKSAIGRIRMQRIADASQESLRPFIAASVEPGSLVHTDGWIGYAGLDSAGYAHKVTILKHHIESA